MINVTNTLWQPQLVVCPQTLSYVHAIGDMKDLHRVCCRRFPHGAGPWRKDLAGARHEKCGPYSILHGRMCHEQSAVDVSRHMPLATWHLWKGWLPLVKVKGRWVCGSCQWSPQNSNASLHHSNAQSLVVCTCTALSLSKWRLKASVLKQNALRGSPRETSSPQATRVHFPFVPEPQELNLPGTGAGRVPPGLPVTTLKRNVKIICVELAVCATDLPPLQRARGLQRVSLTSIPESDIQY